MVIIMLFKLKWRKSNPDAGERAGLQVGTVDGKALFTIRRTEPEPAKWALQELRVCQIYLHALFCDCLDHAEEILNQRQACTTGACPITKGENQ